MNGYDDDYELPGSLFPDPGRFPANEPAFPPAPATSGEVAEDQPFDDEPEALEYKPAPAADSMAPEPPVLTAEPEPAPEPRPYNPRWHPDEHPARLPPAARPCRAGP